VATAPSLQFPSYPLKLEAPNGTSCQFLINSKGSYMSLVKQSKTLSTEYLSFSPLHLTRLLACWLAAGLHIRRALCCKAQGHPSTRRGGSSLILVARDKSRKDSRYDGRREIHLQWRTPCQGGRLDVFLA
jgi:hypothetical protein